MNKSGQSKGSKASKPSSPPPAAKGIGGDLAEAGNMDKIRDILFGNQAKDYDNRFSKIEQTVIEESAELKEELLKRIDALEVYVKQEIKDINERIKNEANERADAVQMIQREMKEGFDALNKKLLHDEENLAKKSTELREQILDQSKSLSAEILSKYDQASNNLKMTAQELDNAKVNRSDLSGFFMEIAMRLSGEDVSGLLSGQNS